MRNSILSVSLVFATLTLAVTSTARAAGPADPTTTTPTSGSMPVDKDRPALAPTTVEPLPAGPGLVFSISSGLSVLGGKIADQLDVSGALATGELKLGYYVTPHLGFVAGAMIGAGALFDGCTGDCSSAYVYQFPVVVQYAFDDRSRGVYVEGGLALLSSYGASTDTENHPDRIRESIAMSTPFDLKAGIGYRRPMGGITSGKRTIDALDVRAGMDVGQFKSLQYSAAGVGAVEGDIAGDKQAMHVAFGLSVGVNFTP